MFVPFVDEFGRGWHGVCYVVERRVEGEQAQNGIGCEDGELLLGECQPLACLQACGRRYCGGGSGA